MSTTVVDEHRKRAYRPRKLHPKRCTHCRRKFQPKRRDALYCSDPCRAAAYRARMTVRRWLSLAKDL